MENRFVLSKVRQGTRSTRYEDVGRFPTKERAVTAAERIKGAWVVTERTVVAQSAAQPVVERRNREADRVDGFDRDDLGESPDY